LGCAHYTNNRQIQSDLEKLLVLENAKSGVRERQIGKKNTLV